MFHAPFSRLRFTAITSFLSLDLQVFQSYGLSTLGPRGIHSHVRSQQGQDKPANLSPELSLGIPSLFGLSSEGQIQMYGRPYT